MNVPGLKGGRPILIGGVAGLYAIALLLQLSISLPYVDVALRPALALPFVLPLLFGPNVALGASFGYALAELVGSAPGNNIVLGALATFLFGMIAYALWGNLGRFSSGEPPLVRSLAPAYWIEFGICALAATAVAAAVTAFSYAMAGTFPFYVPAVLAAGQYFFAVGVFGPLLVYLLATVSETAGYDVRENPAMDAGSSTQSVVVIAGVTAWLAVGSALGVGFQYLRLVPPIVYKRRFDIVVSKEVFEPLRLVSHLLVGLICLFVVARYGWAQCRREGDDR